MKKYIKLLSKIGPYRKERIFILFLCGFSIVIDTMMPYLIGMLVNFVQKGYNFYEIFKFAALIIILGLITAIFDSFQNYKWHIYSAKFSNYFRKEMLKATLSKEPKFFKEHNEDFTSRILHDTIIVAEQISIGFPMLFLNIFRILLVLMIMIFMSIKLTLVVILIVPIYLIFFQKTDKKMRESSQRERSKFTILTDDIKEFIEGVFQIHIYKKEKFFIDKFSEDILSYEKELKQIKLYTALGYGISDLIKIMLPIVILVFGAYEVINSRLELGSLFAFYFYLNFLYEPIINLSNWATNYQIAIGMSDRVFSFLENNEKITEGVKIDSIDKISLNNLSFSFDDKNTILTNLSFDIEKGDIVGIIGPSGSGKSTLINILLKVWNNYSGNIYINNNELREIDRKDYYNKISYIEQESFLFRGSVKENIIFDLNDNEKLRESINLAHLKVKDVNDKVESQGKNFSGGEKQRISIARALFKNANLIILDEFTSALDLEVEKEIVEDIGKNLSKDKIIIMITHRKIPLSICNKIIDLEKQYK